MGQRRVMVVGVVLLLGSLLGGQTFGAAHDPRPTIAPQVTTAQADQRSIDHAGRSSFAPPKSQAGADHRLFAADTGGSFDQYRTTAALPNGLTNYNMLVGRYLSPFISSASLTPEGWLKDAAWNDLVAKQVLPPSAALAMAARNAEPTYQISLVQPLTLQANGTQIIASPIDQASASITSVTSSVPVSFTLTTPNNSVITPAIAASDPAITYTEYLDTTGGGSLWIYVYEVANPATGVWKATTSSPTAGSALLLNYVATTTLLRGYSDKSQYIAGETVTAYAGLVTGSTLTSGATITGSIFYSDLTTSTLTFYDDGTHGDAIVTDGIASSQFVAPNILGYVAIDLTATKDLVQRIDTIGFSIGAQTGQLQGTLTAATPDENGNGLFDSLDITVPYVTTASGHFEIVGALVDATGQYTTTATASTYSTSTTPIEAGSHTLTLYFDGQELRNSGKNGPYTLAWVALSDITRTSFDLDERTNAFTSEAYQALQFEGPMLSLTGGSVQPIEVNGNSLYDQLDVRLTLDVLRPGNYGWNGRLLDPQRNDLGWAQGNGYLTTGTPLLFSFDGSRIGANGQNGPYTLADVSIYQTSGVISNYPATIILDDAYTTPAYTAAQFESASTCAPVPPDELGNGATGNYKVWLPFVKHASGAGLAAAGPAANVGEEGGGSSQLAFVENVGQASEAAVRFLLRGVGGTVFFTPNEAVFSLHDTDGLLDGVLRLHYDGAQGTGGLRAGDKLPGVVNYLKGADPKAWRSNVPTYSDITYQQLYPGIDAQFASHQGGIKSTYVVAPDSDPTQIRWRYLGAQTTTIDPPTGNLLISLPARDIIPTPDSPPTQTQRTLVEQAPVAWQEDSSGTRTPVEVRFALDDTGGISFALGSYDAKQLLYIDPALSYSTYLGSNGDVGNSVVVDSSCQTYVTGSTLSTNFPTANAVPGSKADDKDMFVTKLSADGRTILYSTYLGGSDEDSSSGIARDSAGNLALIGTSDSSDFPIFHAYDTSRGGAHDAVVVSLTADGSAVRYSSYLGGSGEDRGRGVAVDSGGKLYLTGSTAGEFPTKNAYQSTFGGGTFDAYMTTIDPTLTGAASLLYSTYLGHSDTDDGYGVGVDSQGYVVVAGSTASSSFVTRNAYQGTKSGGVDAFVVQLNPAASSSASLRYSTFLGGDGDDEAFGVAVTGAGIAYVTGSSASTNFPTVSPYQNARAGSTDAFVARIDPDLSGSASLTYSTYLGGDNDDQGLGIAVDGGGGMYLTGTTKSVGFPAINALYESFGGGSDGFATQITAAGTALRYSTFLGGSADDEGHGIAVDAAGRAVITGFTTSSDFPLAAAQQNTLSGSNAFVSRVATTE